MAQATTRSGKPVKVADQVTLVGTVTAVTGTGPTATITVQLSGSGNSVSAQGQDLYAAQSL